MLRFIAALAIAGAPMASFAQEAGAPGGPSLSIGEITEIVRATRDGSDPRLRASAPFPERLFEVKMILVTRDRRPLLAYAPALFGGEAWAVGLSFGCAPGGSVEVTQLLRATDGHDVAPGARLELNIRPYGGDEMTMPVERVAAEGDPRRLLRVRGAQPAGRGFFADLGPTTNFQVQLKEDGRFVRFTGGTDLTNMNETLRPLLDHCAQGGGTPEAPAAPVPASPRIASIGTPTGEEIRDALRRDIAARMAVMDAMAGQCDAMRRDQNPLSAVACMMSGFGMASSESVRIDLRSVALDECVAAEGGLAFCRYRTDASMSGAGMMGQIAGFANAAMRLNGPSYASFAREGGQWRLEKVYDRCTWGDGAINCQWTEQR